MKILNSSNPFKISPKRTKVEPPKSPKLNEKENICSNNLLFNATDNSYLKQKPLNESPFLCSKDTSEIQNLLENMNSKRKLAFIDRFEKSRR